MKNQRRMEDGHADSGLATLLAVIGVIILTWGAANNNNMMIWIGGIGTAVFLLGQFILVHAEFGKLWQHIDDLEEKSSE